MKPSFLKKLVPCLAVAALALGANLSPARADDFGKRITVDVAPNYDLATTGDALRAPFPGLIPVGYGASKPYTNDLLLDYGADFRITKSLHLSYTHSNFDFTLGPIISGPAEIETGSISDYTDTIGLNYSGLAAKGFVFHANYFNHVRPFVSGLCLNQTDCGTATLSKTGNPQNIDEHGYVFGGTYSFGPMTAVGPLLTAGFDLKYVPRSNTPPETVAQGLNLGGLGSYVGSQTMFPYSITAKLPISSSHTFIPFLGYERASVLFRAEATPEVYNVVDFGFAKVLTRNIVLSVTNLNFKECRCSDTVPPPDNVRFTDLIMKLDFKTGL